MDERRRVLVICDWCDHEWEVNGHFEDDEEFDRLFYPDNFEGCPECEHDEFCWLEDLSIAHQREEER